MEGRLSMTIKERIEAVLRGELPDRIPFTIYHKMLPRGGAERRLRERGLGFAWRTEVIKWEYPNCQITACQYAEGGVDKQRITWRTPIGEVHYDNILNGAYGSAWRVGHPIRSRDDYRVMEYIARDARPVPVDEDVRRLQDSVGEDGYVIGSLGYSPLMEMIEYLIGVNNYGYEMMDNADPFWSLYEAMRDKMRRAYPLVAKSPVHLVLYDGNIHPQVVGLPRFEQYIKPCLEELGCLLHENGKLLGSHLDADNRAFMTSIAHSSLDVVEAFTPPPDCSVSLQEARAAWPDKIIWCNYPSSVHLADGNVIRQTTAALLAETAPGDRFILGITEDIPEDRVCFSLGVIADVLDQAGKTPIS